MSKSHRQDRTASDRAGPSGDGGAAGATPGKVSRVQQLQRQASGVAPQGSEAASARVHEAAHAGVAGPAQALPHLDRIQPLFGRHDVTGIRAHVGGPAAVASKAMGASAYATGDAVAFREAPDLHTAAHEAAHVVQQRDGVHLKGGVGEAGDVYEQHADAVADRVVRGESAADLLSAHPSAGRTAGQLPRDAGRAQNDRGSASVQRQEAPAAELLTPGQVALAISFYQGKPDLYPPDVITKIQHAVHSPETGSPDAKMVLGVARFQFDAVLKVDGMAGPRTLPRLFESGLATAADRKAFVASGKAVEASWATLATPQARADKLFEGIKTLLANEKVPVPAMALGDLGKAAGLFEAKPWKITFDRTALSPATIDDDAAKELSGTAYHEARHAEQHHKMARMLAARGNTAPQIQAQMGIPAEVAEDAAGNKLPRGVEFATAAQQFDAEYGAGKAHYAKAEAEAPSAAELKAAQAAVAEDPSPANKAKLARLVAAYKAYHDLPTENDAFRTELDFQESWDESTATP